MSLKTNPSKKHKSVRSDEHKLLDSQIVRLSEVTDIIKKPQVRQN